MKAYYASRAVLSLAVGALFVITGAPWWTGLLVGAVAFGWFLAAPHIGRYSVHPEFGVTALRRDERSQAINDRAARNAFVICMLALGTLMAYATGVGISSLPVAVLKWVGFVDILNHIRTCRDCKQGLRSEPASLVCLRNDRVHV